MNRIFTLSVFALLFSIIIPAQTTLQDINHYKFEISLRDIDDSIKVISTIDGTTSNKNIVLNLKSYMSIDSITSTTTHLPFQRVKNSINIKVGENDFSFKIYYKGIPLDGLIIGKNKFGKRTFFGDNWPNRASNWLSVYDHPSDKASVEFIVNAPSKYRVVANGRLLDKKLIDDNFSITHFKTSYQLSTKLMVIGVAEFSKQTVQKSPYEIVSFVYPENKLEALYDYAIAPQITSFFEALIDRYPFDKLYNVQSTTRYGGMENAGCIFYDENSINGKRTNEDLLAHEIAHQWFGNSVSEKDWQHVWLSEGFATYLENIYMENKYGPEKLKKIMEREKWRVLNYKSQFPYKVLVPTNVEDPNTMLNAYSYQKGAWVLHMLRMEVGDDVFFNILREFYLEFKYSNADTDDFIITINKVSGKDLKPLLEPWLYSNKLPEYEVNWIYENGNAKGSVIQKQGDAIFFNTVELLFKFKNGSSKLERVNINNVDTPFDFEFITSPVEVIIDPNDLILKF